MEYKGMFLQKCTYVIIFFLLLQYTLPGYCSQQQLFFFKENKKEEIVGLEQWKINCIPVLKELTIYCAYTSNESKKEGKVRVFKNTNNEEKPIVLPLNLCVDHIKLLSNVLENIKNKKIKELDIQKSKNLYVAAESFNAIRLCQLAVTHIVPKELIPMILNCCDIKHHETINFDNPENIVEFKISPNGSQYIIARDTDNFAWLYKRGIADTKQLVLNPNGKNKFTKGNGFRIEFLSKSQVMFCICN